MDQSDNTRAQNLLSNNLVDEEDKDRDEDNDSIDEDQDDDLDDEQDEEKIKDDILRPASTRSKIVVNLREPVNANGKKKGKFSEDDEIIYDLDKYDKVRMQLLMGGQKLYKAYCETIEEIKANRDLQPRKRKMPIYMWLPLYTFIIVFLVFFFYLFFLIV